MSVLFLLMMASLLVALLFLGAFLWSVRSGQFDDTGTPPLRMLSEDGQIKKAAGGFDRNIVPPSGALTPPLSPGEREKPTPSPTGRGQG